MAIASPPDAASRAEVNVPWTPRPSRITGWSASSARAAWAPSTRPSTPASAEPPPVARYSSDAPEKLQRIISKALAKDRDRRYQSMLDLAVDLESLRLEGDPAHAVATTMAQPVALLAVAAVVLVYAPGFRQSPGRYDEALALYESIRSIEPDGSDRRAAYVYAATGRAEEARQLLKGRESSAVYAALGDKDAAFRNLEKAVDARSSLLVYIKEDPWYEPLHSDPRWKALLRRMNFPEGG